MCMHILSNSSHHFFAHLVDFWSKDRHTSNLVFLKNGTDFLIRETGFCQFSNMASSGLMKMLI